MFADMSKTPKKPKKLKDTPQAQPEPTIEQVEKLLENDEYKKYVQDYNRRMRRLQREASGEFMYEPE